MKMLLKNYFYRSDKKLSRFTVTNTFLIYNRTLHYWVNNSETSINIIVTPVNIPERVFSGHCR